MPTAIGVFTSREHAERAFQKLLAEQVPRESISLLTPESSEHRHTGRTVGAYVGGAIGSSTGLSLGLAAATLAVPGIGPVLAIGLGAAALLGFGGITAGKSVGSGLDALNDNERASGAPDAEFFYSLLRQDRSVIVVETTDTAVHNRASAILDRLGIGAQPDDAALPGTIASRNEADVLVIALTGRVVAGDSTAALREVLQQAFELGNRKLLVDMSAVTFLDSSGIGELVHGFIRVSKAGGQMKLTRLPEKISELMRITHLDKVMDIQPDDGHSLAAMGN